MFRVCGDGAVSLGGYVVSVLVVFYELFNGS